VEAAMAKMRRAATLGHRSNLGEDVEQVQLEAGQEVTVLKEWADRYLCKTADGRLFNVAKELIEP
jgi:hypothetical protein